MIGDWTPRVIGYQRGYRVATNHSYAGRIKSSQGSTVNSTDRAPVPAGKSTGQRSNGLPSQVQSRSNCTTTVPGIQVHNRISGATGSSHPTCSSGRTVRPRNQGIRLHKGKRRLDFRPFSSQRSTAHIHETRGFGYNSSRGCTAITRDSASSPTRRHGVLGRLHRRNWC